jgi:hypothetical protein
VPVNADAFAYIVRQSALVARGMPAFGEFSDAELKDLSQYIRAQSELWREQLGNRGPP